MADTHDTTSLLNFIVDRAHVGIFVVNRDREVLLWNQFMEIHSERKATSVVGKNLFDEFPELPRKWLERKIESVFILKNFSFTSWEQRPYLFKFAHNRPVTGGVDSMRQDCTLMPVKDADGEVQYVCFTLFDTTDTSIYQTQLKEAMVKLEAASNIDGLTQLFNRRFIEATLSREFSRARRYGHTVSLIMTDIDHFKSVNDNHGHLTGDEVLREVSQRLKSCLRDSDILGRYGGEEFMIVLPETGIEGAKTLAERLRVAIEKAPTVFNDKSLPITISLGITEISERANNYEAMIGEADKALYLSKAAGRNQVSVFICTESA